MTPISSNTHNRIIAPICLGVALILGILFLRPLYASYIEDSSVLSSLEKNRMNLTTEYDGLMTIKHKIWSNISQERRDRIDKLEKKYDTSEIMSAVMLSDFTKDSTDGSARIVIGSINVWKWKKLPNGLSLGSVWVSIQWKTVADIIDFITSLTQQAGYVFTIDNISLPIDTAPEDAPVWSYGLSLSLGVYYYE